MYEGMKTAMAEIIQNMDHIDVLAIDNPNINTFFSNLWTKRNQMEITLGKHNTEYWTLQFPCSLNFLEEIKTRRSYV